MRRFLTLFSALSVLIANAATDVSFFMCYRPAHPEDPATKALAAFEKDNPEIRPRQWGGLILPGGGGRSQFMLALAGGSGTNRGTGGMITKLHAAQIATAAGIDTVVMNGSDPEDIYKLIDGRQIGTLFRAKTEG